MDWSIKFKKPQRNLYGHSTDSVFRFVGANASNIQRGILRTEGQGGGVTPS